LPPRFFDLAASANSIGRRIASERDGVPLLFDQVLMIFREQMRQGD
jgi:hypothetical protein